MTHIISVPSAENTDTQGQNDQYHFGYFELKGRRTQQEDALAWHVLTESELTPQNGATPLTPTEIGHRLWTSYQLLDTLTLRAGTTASTTVYDGRGNLVTATLADTVAFAVVYGKDGNVLGVKRLNTVTHLASDPQEKARIEQEGGFVPQRNERDVSRVNGALAVSRAIGDQWLKKSGVCSEAQIDVTNVEKIAEELQIDPNDIGFMHIITTCDGFTEEAGEEQTKEQHEQYLLKKLRAIASPGTLSEKDLSQELASGAYRDGSTDNISVGIQRLDQNTPPFFLGLYDGHGGKQTSTFVAQSIGETFRQQCALTPTAYAQQKLSVNQRQDRYKRDNTDASTPHLDRDALIAFFSPSVSPEAVSPEQVQLHSVYDPSPIQSQQHQAYPSLGQSPQHPAYDPSPEQPLQHPVHYDPSSGQSPQHPVHYDPSLGQSPQHPAYDPSLGQSPQHPAYDPSPGQSPQHPAYDPSPGQSPQHPAYDPSPRQSPERSAADIPECQTIVDELNNLTRDYLASLAENEEERYLRQIVRELASTLDSSGASKDKIKAFYTFLNQDASPNTKNIDVIKRDDRVFASNYLKGIGIIAAILVTGIIPGLIITGIVYHLTGGRHPLDFFKTNGERFEKEINLIKTKNPTYAAFFRPEPPEGEDQEEELLPRLDL